MSALSNYLENKLIDHIFRGVAFTAPGTLYLGLFTAAPSDAGGGTEVSGGSYARVAITPNSTNFANTQNSGVGVSSGTGGATSNLTTITFPSPSASWGLCTHIGMFDASTAGNLLYHGALTVSRTVDNGGPAPVVNIGEHVFTFA